VLILNSKRGVCLETKIIIINKLENDIAAIEEASGIIQEGGTVVFPTETVYGLGANALDEKAVKKIFEAKGRPQDNPLIMHVCSKEILEYVEEVPVVAQKLIDKFWPGPLTIILNKKSVVPDITSAGLKSIGIRMPKNEIALKLIEFSKVPIAAPSANISGRPSPTEVKRCIEDLSGKVDYIIGGKQSEVGLESTIVDCTVYPPLVLRPGGITLDMLKEIDKTIEMDKGILAKPNNDLKPKAPGMKYRHYAPKALVKIIKGKDEKVIEKINEMVDNYIGEGMKVGILASKRNISKYSKGNVKLLGSNIEEVAKNLFEALRGLDDLGVDIILSEAFEEKGVGIAVMNRLNKAAGFNIIIV